MKKTLFLRKKLTKEKVIGISCSSTAGLFAIVAIINFVIQKKYSLKEYNDEENGHISENEQENIEVDSNCSADIDFWIWNLLGHYSINNKMFLETSYSDIFLLKY